MPNATNPGTSTELQPVSTKPDAAPGPGTGNASPAGESKP